MYVYWDAAGCCRCQNGDFVNAAGMEANSAMTFYGQEKVEYNAQLCLMNMAVHGLTGVIKSGDEANTFYHDAHNLDGCCDYVMANPPFNVDKVNSESAQSAGRLPFGLPSVNAKKEFGNANYLWISYFYSYLNEKGRAGFVMASSATDSSGKDRDIRQQLVETGHVDVMVSVGNNFFYTKSLPCSLWFFDKGKPEGLQDKVLFLDARNYYTVVDRTLNEWSEWQLRNLNAIVWLYRGEKDKYTALLEEYRKHIALLIKFASDVFKHIGDPKEPAYDRLRSAIRDFDKKAAAFTDVPSSFDIPNAIDDVFSSWKYALDQISSRISPQYATNMGYKSVSDFKKRTYQQMDTTRKAIQDALSIREAQWLYEKFGEGEYQDIPGLCKVASRAEIAEKNYSLTPGAYVGVAAVEDDGVDFAQRMGEIHRELLVLQTESNELMQTISKNMKEIGL